MEEVLTNDDDDGPLEPESDEADKQVDLAILAEVGDEIATTEITRSQLDELRYFEDDVMVLSRIKRMLLRHKLKKEKVRLLRELVEVQKKIKILDGLDNKIDRAMRKRNRK